MSIIILFALLIIVVIIIVIWVAYSVSAAYQQTLSITVPFDETYRYIPNLNKDHKFKLDSIKVTITGTIKKDSILSSTIVPASHVKQLIHENIISPYKDCLLIHESNTFIIEETILKRNPISSNDTDLDSLIKRCPIIKQPTLENLSILFFNKLAPIMPKKGCQLVSITLLSEGIKVSHSRYKISNYRV